MSYRSRQYVADIIGVKGGVWEALEGGYLHAEEMPDEQCWVAALALKEGFDAMAVLESAFLDLLPEVEMT